MAIKPGPPAPVPGETGGAIRRLRYANVRQQGGTAMARPAPEKWSGEVTRRSDALDLESGVFKLRSPRRIAQSLKRSAERSRRRKSDPYRSAMSMLTFYINRAGRNLSATRRRVLEKAKTELRKLYGRRST
ncbi:MAG: DUF3175 domain-containing protein [Rhodospirillales bacterium]